jgi:plasmid stability protein
MAAPMASMTIRNLDERLKARLRVRPAKNGGSMEDEARDIVQPLRALQLGRAW